MGWDGPQTDCRHCGWSNFAIRKLCRGCGRNLTGNLTMEHARSDYANIQEITTNGTTRLIPADEPVFLIRGQDAVGADAVRAWAYLAESAGAAPDIVQVARDHAAKMDAWPKKKTPDLAVSP